MTDYRQLISYAGLNPTEHSSGTSIRGRGRISKRGGYQLRHILYMCAMNAMQTNRACRELYQRLISKGKNGKVAIIAVCNKRSEEHTSELQSRPHLVCRLLLEKKKQRTERV